MNAALYKKKIKEVDRIIYLTLTVVKSCFNV